MGGLVLLALLIWFGIHLLNRWRIEGEGFRINAGRRLSELVDRPISTARFRQTGPNQLSTATLTLKPILTDILASVTATNLSAEFTPASWLADEWTVPTLRFATADLTFQPDKKLDDQTMYSTTLAVVPRAAPPPQGFRIGMTAEPASVTVEQGRFDQLNLAWPSAEGKPESLTGLLGNYRLLGGTLQLDLADGILDTAAWPAFGVQQINARLTGTRLEIISARLGFTADHQVRATGTADLIPDGQLTLTAEISPIQLKHLLPDLWTQTVLGNFESSAAVWKSSFKTGPAPSFSGPFSVKGWVLRGMPFVDKIANLLRKPDLALLEFPMLSGQFLWTPNHTTLTNLNAATGDGLLRLTGSAKSVPGSAVTGEFTLAANEAYFAGLPGEAADLFSPNTDGWRTLTFTIGGDAAGITDNIGTASPIIIRNRTTAPDMASPSPSTPAAVPPPAARPALRPASATPPPTRLAPPPQPVPVRPPPSDAELERQFNSLLGR